MVEHAKVVVIGGGAMGVSLLYHLTKEGWSDVVLVEKNELTAGSTWHAAGLCTHFAHNLTIMHMRAHSVRLYSEILPEETGNPVGFHKCGALRVTRSADRMDEFRHVQGIGRYAGFDFHVLSPDELKEIYPFAETDGLLGAIHEPDDGYVDPSQATHAMAAGARAGGARIQRNNPVEGLEQKPSGEWIVHTASGDIECEMVVNAAGTWCREIGGMMGIDLPVVPMLHQYLVTDSLDVLKGREKELPMIRDPEESWYVRQERDGLIVGPYEKDGVTWSIDGVPPEFGMELLPPDLDRIEHIVASAMERVPILADAGIKTVVNGPITFTPDANPLIGPAFGLRNAWLLTGSSMGVMEGGGAGKLLAEWMIGGEPPMDALAVDSRRFGGYADRDYRIAKAVESFGNQFAVHYPFEERTAGRPAKTSAIHDDLDKAGASFGAAYGWERPNWFARDGGSREPCLSFRRANWFEAVADECRAVADRVALADITAFSKFQVTGDDATAFMETLGANRAPVRVGGIGLTHALTPKGGVRSEFSVTRTGEASYYLVSAAAAERQDLDLLHAHARGFRNVTVENRTHGQSALAVMGPMARDLLSRISDHDFSNDAFPWLTGQNAVVAGKPVLALRVSYVGELGWELHCANTDLRPVYDALLDAGQSFDIGHYGAFAMNAMRLEKGYRAWGMDLSTERTPIEAGLGRFVKPEGRSFEGADSLRRSSNGFEMVLLELDDGPDPFAMHTLFVRDQIAGLVTSAAYGHRVARPLALAYLKPGIRQADVSLIAKVLNEQVAARILEAAPYDLDNRRMRG